MQILYEDDAQERVQLVEQRTRNLHVTRTQIVNRLPKNIKNSSNRPPLNEIRAIWHGHETKFVQE